MKGRCRQILGPRGSCGHSGLRLVSGDRVSVSDLQGQVGLLYAGLGYGEAELCGGILGRANGFKQSTEGKRSSESELGEPRTVDGMKVL